MVKVLPEWNGKVVGTMHRMFMTKEALADTLGYQRTYISRMLWSPNHRPDTKAKVEDALESFARSHGIDFDKLWAREERTNFTF